MKKTILITALMTLTFFASSQTFIQKNKTWTEFVWDTITFEEPYEYLEIDTSSQNIWQIGKPNKIFFDSAYSIPNAIVTDTLNFYPLNNNSYFDLKVGTFNYNGCYPGDIFIEIKHKFDTDTLKDGGFITVSYDNGLTWMNIINDTIYYGGATPSWDNENLYDFNDTLYNGQFGFSGHSNGWITTMFAWHEIHIKNNLAFIGDTMIIRFNFVSDSIENNKEGWMIDNVKLYSEDLGWGIYDIKSLKFNITPNPMIETAIIKLDSYNEIQLSIFNIQGQLVRQKNYFNNQSIIINKEKLNTGIYMVKIRTDKNLVGIRKLIIK